MAAVCEWLNGSFRIDFGGFAQFQSRLITKLFFLKGLCDSTHEQTLLTQEQQKKREYSRRFLNFTTGLGMHLRCQKFQICGRFDILILWHFKNAGI
jgi:hypothetical protein